MSSSLVLYEDKSDKLKQKKYNILILENANITFGRKFNVQSLFQKCEISRVDQWIDLRSGKILMNCILSESLRLEFKKHTGNDFPYDMFLYSKPINLSQEEISLLIPKLEDNNLKKEVESTLCKISHKIIEQFVMEQDYKNTQRKFESHVTAYKMLEFINGSYCAQQILKSYYVHSKSHCVYVIDREFLVNLVLITDKHDMIVMDIEKSHSKMVSIKIVNLKGEYRLLYNFDNSRKESVDFYNEKITFYDNQEKTKRNMVGTDDSSDDGIELDIQEDKIYKYAKHIEDIRKEMCEYEIPEICATIKNRACLITHGSIIICCDDNITYTIKENPEASVISIHKSSNYKEKAIIKNTKTDEIVYDLTMYKSNNFSFRNSFVGNFILLDVDGGDIWDDGMRKYQIFALYNIYTNEIYLYKYTLSKSKDIAQKSILNIASIIKQCELLSYFPIGKLQINLDPITCLKKMTSKDSSYNEISRSTGFKNVKVSIGHKREDKLEKYVVVEFSNETDKQVMIFPHENGNVNKLCDAYYVMNDVFVHINQTKQNDVLMSYFLSTFIRKYFGIITNKNKEEKFNKNRIKKYKKKLYVYFVGTDGLYIYSKQYEYVLKNVGDNFNHCSKKMDMEFVNFTEQMKNLTNKKIGVNDVTKFIAEIMELKYENKIPFDRERLTNETLNGELFVKNSELYYGKLDHGLRFHLVPDGSDSDGEDEYNKIVLSKDVKMFGMNDVIIEILEVSDEDTTFSIDEYNVGYITENFVFVKKYDRSNGDFVTIHDLRKLDEKGKKEFDKMQSCHILNKNTELGKFNFVKETGLQKEYIYHMNLYMIHDDLVMQDINNFIIVCGFGDFVNWVGGLFKSTDTVNHKSSNSGANSRVTHNGKEVFRKENNVIIANKMKIGKIEDFPRTVWKVAHIKETKTFCIIKMVLPEDTVFVRPYSENNWNGQLYMGKSRCDKAVVASIQEYSFAHEVELPDGTEAESSHANECAKLIYRVGDLVFPDKFDESNEECSNGIHVFEERHHIVSLTGDEEVRPLSIIKKIMPNEMNMIISLAELKIGAEEKKRDYDMDDYQTIEMKETFYNRPVSLPSHKRDLSTTNLVTTNPIVENRYLGELGIDTFTDSKIISDKQKIE